MLTPEEEADAKRRGFTPDRYHVYEMLGKGYWKRVDEGAERIRQERFMRNQWPRGVAEEIAELKLWEAQHEKEGLPENLPNPFDFQQLSTVRRFEIVAVSAADSYL